MSERTPLKIAAESKAMELCRACNSISTNEDCQCRILEDAFLSGAAYLSAPTYEQIEAAVNSEDTNRIAASSESTTPHEGLGPALFLAGVAHSLSIIRALYGKKEGEG